MQSKNPMQVLNPYNGYVVGDFWLADEAMLEKSVEAALLCSQELAEMPAYAKNEALSYIALRLKEELEEYARLITLESAKPIRYARSEVARAIQTFIVAAEECKRLPGEVLQLDWTAAGGNKEGIVKYFPIGLVSGIAPFNYPLNLAVHKIAPALAAGCPILLKPATATPLSTLKLAHIIHDSGFPNGCFSVLPMNRKTGNLLVTDERIKLLSFTGSPEVGWKMKAQAGKKKVVLELGGNAGLIITETANIKDAIAKSLIGGFSYSGQVCIHTQRIYVHKSIWSDFITQYIQGVKALRSGDPLLSETEVSSMIDEVNALRVEEWINEALEAGASLLCGGLRKGSWLEPTLLTNTQNTMKVCSSEVFGPVVIVEPYEEFSQAVEMVNQGSFGLQAGIFTNAMHEVNYAFNRLEVGGVILNDVPTFRVDHMPYGGVKDSGLGREGVKYAMMDMLEARILVKPVR